MARCISLTRRSTSQLWLIRGHWCHRDRRIRLFHRWQLITCFGPSSAGNSLVKSALLPGKLGDPGSDLAIPLKEDTELAVVGTATWASVSSPVALEALATHPAAPALEDLTGDLPAVVSVSKPARGRINIRWLLGTQTAPLKVFGSPADALSCITDDTSHPSSTAVFNRLPRQRQSRVSGRHRRKHQGF